MSECVLEWKLKKTMLSPGCGSLIFVRRLWVLSMHHRGAKLCHASCLTLYKAGEKQERRKQDTSAFKVEATQEGLGMLCIKPRSYFLQDLLPCPSGKSSLNVLVLVLSKKGYA